MKRRVVLIPPTDEGVNYSGKIKSDIETLAEVDIWRGDLDSKCVREIHILRKNDGFEYHLMDYFVDKKFTRDYSTKGKLVASAYFSETELQRAA